jgi:hypothetical protein
MPALIRLLAAAIVLALLGGCTRTIDSGQYGYLNIGASKEATLDALERADQRGVAPVVDPPIHLVNPKRADLDVLRNATGIAVTAEEHPIALRIEFEGDMVGSSRPNFGEYPYIPRYPYSGPALLAQMQVRIYRGLDHAGVFDVIASFKTEQKIEVDAFVAGYDKMRHTEAKPWLGEYRGLLLANDAWRFEGLKDEVWYPARGSAVELHFRQGKLAEIVHRLSLF